MSWLDANLFIHALFPRNRYYRRCTDILEAPDNSRSVCSVNEPDFPGIANS